MYSSCTVFYLGLDAAVVVEVEFQPRNVIVRRAAEFGKLVRPDVRVRPIVVQSEPVVPVQDQVRRLLIVAEQYVKRSALYAVTEKKNIYIFNCDASVKL